MINSKRKIKHYSRIAWIDDSTAHKNDRDYSPLPSFKRQKLISSSANLSSEQLIEFSTQLFNDILEENNVKNKLSQDFLFDFINNADKLISYKLNILSLSSIYLTPEILDLTDYFNQAAANHEKQVTQSQQMPNMELFSLLSFANSPEVPEPKIYKQAVSK